MRFLVRHGAPGHALQPTPIRDLRKPASDAKGATMFELRIIGHFCCARAASRQARPPRACAARRRRPPPPGAEPLQPENPKSRRTYRRSLPLGDGADDGVLGRRLRRDRDLCWRDRRPWDGGAVLGTRRPSVAGSRRPPAGRSAAPSAASDYGRSLAGRRREGRDRRSVVFGRPASALRLASADQPPLAAAWWRRRDRDREWTSPSLLVLLVSPSRPRCAPRRSSAQPGLPSHGADAMTA